MKRHSRLAFKIILFVPILLGIVIVNWVVDPANVYMDKHSANELVNHINAGEKVTLPYENMNFEGRFVIKRFVDTLKKNIDVIVLGSSRSMMIAPDIFPGKSFFNASVASAGIEDYILNYGFFHQKGAIPSTIVIGVDQSIFDSFRSSRFKQWVAYRETYDYMMRSMSHEKALWSVNFTDYLPPQYLEIFSFGYFQASLFALQQQTRPSLLIGIKEKFKPSSQRKEKFIVTDKEYNEFLTILPGGFVITPSKTNRERPVDQVEKLITRDQGSMSNVTQRFHFDQERVELFESFLGLLKKDNVDIVLFLPPVHPASIGPAEKTPQYRTQLERIEKYIHGLADQNGIKVVGSYFNERAGVPVGRFYDEHHLRSMDDIRAIFRSQGFIKK
jgi:hypothetical protein